mmetsp:Transcript_34230/g.100737  ORF Transcript_34230/g.100737 Transcript_34230/m.100737 type:complete len:171 (-) Transcript_34230:1531-2043(-)
MASLGPPDASYRLLPERKLGFLSDSNQFARETVLYEQALQGSTKPPRPWPRFHGTWNNRGKARFLRLPPEYMYMYSTSKALKSIAFFYPSRSLQGWLIIGCTHREKNTKDNLPSSTTIFRKRPQRLTLHSARWIDVNHLASCARAAAHQHNALIKKFNSGPGIFWVQSTL